MKHKPHRRQTSSWESDAKAYHKLVGKQGHYYHQHLIIPNTLKLLKLTPQTKLLDLGCGQGVLARALPQPVRYTGVDNSPTLISEAKKLDHNPNHEYAVGNAQTIKLPQTDYDIVTLILSLQNMELPDRVIQNASRHLKPQGTLYIVLNHPMFRIPRHSGWGDHPNKIQYRYVNRYLSSLRIPIDMHPGQSGDSTTWTYHFPLSYYTHHLQQHNFHITDIQEWTSNKQSIGKAAKKENRAREEFPLFMTIIAQKQST